MSAGWAVDALLGLSVAGAWAGGFGFLRKGGAVPLHHPSLIAAVSGAALVLAGLFAEGMTARVGKLLLLDALALVSGLVLSHALARAAGGPLGVRSEEQSRRREG